LTDKPWPLDDEPLRFYLQHRGQIEEWASLRDKVSKATKDAFLGLQPRVESLAGELEVNVNVVNAEKGWPRFELFRHTWRTANADLVASVFLEIDGRNVMPDSPADAPYTGILVRDARSSGAALRQGILAEKEGYRAGTLYQGGQLFYRRVIARPNWWEDADQWQSELIAALRATWDKFAARVDQVVDEGSPAAQAG